MLPLIWNANANAIHTISYNAIVYTATATATANAIMLTLHSYNATAIPLML